MSFDLLAPHYRWMEFVLAGEKLQRCRTAFLSEASHIRRVLIVGEGNGRFLSAFLKINPSASVVCVEESSRMLELTRGRLRRAGQSLENVEFIQASIHSWTPPRNEFDLLVTHFFLDCFRPEQLEEIVRRLAVSARPGACWLLSDFCEASHGLPRFRTRWMLAVMYLFFRMVTQLPACRLTPPDSFLEKNGFVLQNRRASEWGLLHADIWRLRENAENPASNPQTKTHYC